MMKKMFFLQILLITSLFSMHRMMMNVSDLDLELNVALDIGQFGTDMGVDSYFFGGSFISTQDGQGDWLYTLDGLFMNDLPDVEGMRFGMGVKVVLTDNGTELFLAAPVGVVLDYLIQTKNNLPLFAVGSIYYAPSALSFADAKSYFEYRAEIHYELVQNLRVFAGYRSINTSFNSHDAIFNQTLYGGARLGF